MRTGLIARQNSSGFKSLGGKNRTTTPAVVRAMIVKPAMFSDAFLEVPKNFPSVPDS